jgi:hypothetical protein
VIILRNIDILVGWRSRVGGCPVNPSTEGNDSRSAQRKTPPKLPYVISRHPPHNTEIDILNLEVVTLSGKRLSLKEDL